MNSAMFYFYDRWPWILLGLVLLLVAILRARAKRRKLLDILRIDLDQYPESKPIYRTLKEILYFIGALCLAIAVLGPQWGQRDQMVVSRGVDLCLALDLSGGMNAEDVSPGRLQLLKNHLSMQLPNMQGNQVGLVTFAGTANLASPLTTDPTALGSLVDIMDTTYFSDRSTNIGGGLETCLEVLRVKEARRIEDLPEDRSKAVLLMSDGEDNNGLYEAVIKRYKTLGIPIFAMAVGTLEGGPVPVRDESGTLTRYEKDPKTGQLTCPR